MKIKASRNHRLDHFEVGGDVEIAWNIERRISNVHDFMRYPPVLPIGWIEVLYQLDYGKNWIMDALERLSN